MGTFPSTWTAQHRSPFASHGHDSFPRRESRVPVVVEERTPRGELARRLAAPRERAGDTATGSPRGPRGADRARHPRDLPREEAWRARWSRRPWKRTREGEPGSRAGDGGATDAEADAPCDPPRPAHTPTGRLLYGRSHRRRGRATRSLGRDAPPSVLPRGPWKFTESVARSSTQPADRPLPRRAFELGFGLLALRARCSRHPRGHGSTGQGRRSPDCRNLRELSLVADLRGRGG